MYRSHGAGPVVVLVLFLSVVMLLPRTAPAQSYGSLLSAGFAQLKGGEYRAARDTFEQAIRMNDREAAGHLGLGMAYFHLQDDRSAERSLLKALELNPREAGAYHLLGEIAYRTDDLESAADYWEKAVALTPNAPGLKARLDRIRREHSTEKDFNRDVTSHFLVKYEGREKIEAGRIVLRILESAYGEIGRALNYFPDREIQVILYSERQFQEVTDAPGWSGGIFDGKIRLPIGGIEQETPALRRILYHEYTHAVVRAMTPRVPAWLNEGLAQHFEGRRIEDRHRAALKRLVAENRLPSLRDLEGSFMGLESNEAAVAYLLSLSAVQHLINDFGLYRIVTILEELNRGSTVDAAIDRALLVSYDDFQRSWKRSLE